MLFITPQIYKHYRRKMHIADKCYFLYISLRISQFTIHNGTLYILMQDNNKSFEALAVPKSLALTILIKSHNLQRHARTITLYCLIKRDYFWKGMQKDIDKFTPNCHMCKQLKFQKQYYSYLYTKPAK